jgi:hypothetical protein
MLACFNIPTFLWVQEHEEMLRKALAEVGESSDDGDSGMLHFKSVYISVFL